MLQEQYTSYVLQGLKTTAWKEQPQLPKQVKQKGMAQRGKSSLTLLWKCDTV